MKKIWLILCVLIGSVVYSQTLCEQCADVDGFFCGDDPTNWTQYSPNGCVQNSWLNDGWEDCVDASDENGAVPTTLADCSVYVEPCDTVYVEIPVIEYIYETDTLYVDNYIIDTVNVVEFVVEYIDCETGAPCDNSSLIEIMKLSFGTNILYNLQGQVIRKPEGIYIENGEVKYKF